MNKHEVDATALKIVITYPLFKNIVIITKNLSAVMTLTIKSQKNSSIILKATTIIGHCKY